MTTLRRESLAEQAADALGARISAGEWEIGDKLPGETTLAPQLGVGRSTIREAIRHLAGRGMLTSRQGAGVFVAATEPVADWATLVGTTAIRSVIEARVAIEVEASARAAERHSPTEQATMRQRLHDRGQAQPSVAGLVDADMALHRSIVVAAHNPILIELFDACASRSRVAMIELLEARERPDENADHAVHSRILDAIEERDAQLAAALTRAHLLELESRLDRS
ncbi:MAG: FadR/GntR family transcriptional regulator [Mycetocola sp.]